MAALRLGALIVFAHAGHWLVSLAYIAPLIFLVGVILVGKIRDRRSGSHRSERLTQPFGHMVRIDAQMSHHELKLLLDQVPDTRELILRRERAAVERALQRVERRPRGGRGCVAHLAVRRRPRGLMAYRAAADREDAAQDALAAASPAA